MSSEKKQRLSKDLTKSYILILMAFIIVGAIISLTTWEYLKGEAKKDVSFTRNFLAGEFMEEELQNPSELFEDAVKELPDMGGIDFGIKAGEKVYQTGNLPDIEMEYTDGIKRYRGYSYYAYNYKLPLYSGGSVDVIIVKSMHEEKKFIYHQLRVYLIAIPLMFILVYLIYRHFYNKIIPQLREIEGVTNSINIDTLNVRLARKGYYEEFDNILSSYEKMLERLENQTNAHIEFVHNASHELKTPIFVIKGYSDILSKWGMENREISAEAVEAIGSEVRSMQSLTEKLLFLARGRDIAPVREEVQVDQVIDEVGRELSYRYKDIGVVRNLAPVSFFTDRELLKILIKNIMENAMKYGMGRDIRLESGYRGEVPFVVVEDRGNGMTGEEVENIFTEFYRGEKSRNKEIGGHGLGMSIVKNIKTVLGIEIEVSSEPGQGTIVEILLKGN